jgi:hypothetical protein
MSSPKPPEPPPPPVKLDYLAAVLSYLIPGLGQLYQGRVRKGLLFLVSLYALFFYGMSLGHWQNVYLPEYEKGEGQPARKMGLGTSIYTRFQFVGQVPIGVVAWPAVYQYMVYQNHTDENAPLNGWMRAPSLQRLNDLQRDGDKTWDLGWVYTIIAGVLNVLVIYDALAGPAFREVKAAPPEGVPAA